MKKGLLLPIIVMVLIAFPQQTKAQSLVNVGIGAELAAPMGDFSDVAELGYGLSARGELTIGPKMMATAHIGYLMWGGKEFGYYTTDYTDIPIMVGIKLSLAAGLYAHGEIGYHFFSMDTEASELAQFTVADLESSDQKFGASVGGGLETPLAPLTALDISVKYNYVADDLSYFSGRIGVKFGL